jgi:hypothetical protein
MRGFSLILCACAALGAADVPATMRSVYPKEYVGHNFRCVLKYLPKKWL